MELRQLRYFVAVAQELNFTRAAMRLRVAQPALSRQIRQLEDEIGGALFERDRRRVALTDAGRSLFAAAQTLLRQSALAIQQAQATLEHQCGALDLGYVWGLFHSLVPPWLAMFRRARPDISINLLDLTAAEQARRLVARQLDAGFIGFGDEANTAGLAKLRVGDCAFCLVLPTGHRLARPGSPLPGLADLAEDWFVAVSENSYPGAARVLERAAAAHGFRPRILSVAERGFTILGLVAANCGVALLPETLQALPHPGVVFRRLRAAPREELYLVWNRRGRSALLPAFIDELKRCAAVGRSA